MTKKEGLVKITRELQRELDFNIELDKQMGRRLEIANEHYSAEVTYQAQAEVALESRARDERLK